MNPKVDQYLIDGCGRCPLGATPQCKVNKWPEELKQLRIIILGCGLDEELKWGMPCYTFQKSNVLMLSAFKEYCSVGFFKGALLKDSKGILSKPGENSQAVRQLRFTSVKEIIQKETIIKTYINEAIGIEKSGLKIDFKAKKELSIPDEFESKLKEIPTLKTAFNALTPGRQRAYILFFSAPKQSETRVSRIEKCMPHIFDGKGLNDR